MPPESPRSRRRRCYIPPARSRGLRWGAIVSSPAEVALASSEAHRRSSQRRAGEATLEPLHFGLRGLDTAGGGAAIEHQGGVAIRRHATANLLQASEHEERCGATALAGGAVPGNRL